MLSMFLLLTHIFDVSFFSSSSSCCCCCFFCFVVVWCGARISLRTRESVFLRLIPSEMLECSVLWCIFQRIRFSLALLFWFLGIFISSSILETRNPKDEKNNNNNNNERTSLRTNIYLALAGVAIMCACVCAYYYVRAILFFATAQCAASNIQVRSCTTRQFVHSS